MVPQILRDYVEYAITRIFIAAQFGKSSRLGNADALECADVDVDGRRLQRPATRVQPFGFSSRPTNKVRGVGLRLGASNVLFVGILPTSGYGPQDLEDGETAIWSAEVERALHATSAGDVKLAAKSGQTVQINGDTYALIKTDTFLIDIKNWVTAINATIASNCVNGEPLSAYAANAAAITAFLTSLSVAGAYKSTKAKNG